MKQHLKQFALALFMPIPLAAVFALVSIGICALQVRKASATAGGMLTDVSRLVEDANGAANQARHLSEEQRAFLTKLDPKLLASIAKFNGDLDQVKSLIVTAQGTLNTTTETVAAIKPVLSTAQATIADLQPLEAALTADANAAQIPLDNAGKMLAGATELMQNANTLVLNPDFPKIAGNVQVVTANLAHTTGTLDTFATRLTKPASVVKEFIYHLIGWGASAGSWR